MIFVVDVEADGPCPGIYSMLEYGIVAIYNNRIMGQATRKLAPISYEFLADALNAIGLSREETETFPDPMKSMMVLDDFVNLHLRQSKSNRPLFFSDNNGFDWQFINYYFWKFLKGNPLGFSSNNISNLYGGINNQLRNGDWKKYRITKHSHSAMDDALGNAEALMTICHQNNISLA